MSGKVRVTIKKTAITLLLSANSFYSRSTSPQKREQNQGEREVCKNYYKNLFYHSFASSQANFRAMKRGQASAFIVDFEQVSVSQDKGFPCSNRTSLDKFL